MSGRTQVVEVSSPQNAQQASSAIDSQASSTIDSTDAGTITIEGDNPVSLLEKLAEHSIISKEQHEDLKREYSPAITSSPPPKTLKSIEGISSPSGIIPPIRLTNHQLPSNEFGKRFVLSLVAQLASLKNFSITVTLSDSGQEYLRQALFLEDTDAEQQPSPENIQQQRRENLQTYLSLLPPKQRLEIYSYDPKIPVETRLLMYCMLTIFKQLQLDKLEHPLVPPDENDDNVTAAIERLHQHFSQFVEKFEAKEKLDTSYKNHTSVFITELTNLITELTNLRQSIKTIHDQLTPDRATSDTNVFTLLSNQKHNIDQYNESINTTIDLTTLAITIITAANHLSDQGRINNEQKADIIDGTFRLVTWRGPNPKTTYQTLMNTPVIPPSRAKILGRTAMILGVCIAIAAAVTILTAASFGSALPYIIAASACLSSIITLGGYQLQKPKRKTALATDMGTLIRERFHFDSTPRTRSLDTPLLSFHPTPF